MSEIKIKPNLYVGFGASAGAGEDMNSRYSLAAGVTFDLEDTPADIVWSYIHFERLADVPVEEATSRKKDVDAFGQDVALRFQRAEWFLDVGAKADYLSLTMTNNSWKGGFGITPFFRAGYEEVPINLEAGVLAYSTLDELGAGRFYGMLNLNLGPFVWWLLEKTPGYP